MNRKGLLSIFVIMILVSLLACTTVSSDSAKQSYPISKKDARKIAKEFLEKNFKLQINERKLQLFYDYPVRNEVENYNYNYNSYSNVDICWKFSASIQERGNVNIYIDCMTGKTMAVGVKKNREEAKSILLSRENAVSISREFIKKTNPGEYNEILLAKEETKDSDGEYTFFFDRYTNGVKYYANGIKVSIDKVTGDITYYGWNWDDNIDFLFGKDHAEKIARGFLNKYYGFEDKSIKISFDYDTPIGNHFYDDVGWEMTANIVDDDKSYYSFICVSMFTGKVAYIRVDDETPWSERQITNRVSNEEARVIVENFLKKVEPDKFKETVFMGEYNTPGEGGASFHFARAVNGAIYDENFLELSVDVSNGKIRFFGCLWDEDIVFPSVEGIISKDEAIKVMGDELQLFYYNPHGTNETELVYCFPKKFKGSIDPRIDYKSFQEGKTKRISKDITIAVKEDMIKKASDTESPIRIIDQETARKTFNKYLEILYGMNIRIIDIEYMASDSWFAHFEKIDKENELKGEIKVNALNGELIRVRSNYIDPNLRGYIDENGCIDDVIIDEVEDEIIKSFFKPSLTWEEGYDKAIEAISEIYPDKINNIKTKIGYCESDSLDFTGSFTSAGCTDNNLMKPKKFGGCYSYHFPRIENELPVYNYDGIYIDIDGEGRIIEVGYRCNQDLSFLKPNIIIGKEEAKKIFFEKHKPLLMCERVDDRFSKDGLKMKLLYSLPYEATDDKVDALSGNLRE
ncbi:YcdB/YcdC domain-containing protein [Wukongibacter sp. M2B1]|uniref:YcdB/YcdC domain-containing protein n=1 Tax=Wukongibacter sp. M2B1 TaxID=3088895 RepID=UPI003D7AA50E